MILVSALFVICLFFLSGLLSGAIAVNDVEHRPNTWPMYLIASSSFFLGLYWLIVLIGKAGNV